MPRSRRNTATRPSSSRVAATPRPSRRSDSATTSTSRFGKGCLELRDEQWTPLQKAHEKQRDPRGFVRPGCFATPGLLDQLAAQAGTEVERARPRLRFVALADEARRRGTTRAGHVPVRALHGGLPALRAERFKTLDAVNQALGAQCRELRTRARDDRPGARRIQRTLLPADAIAFAVRLDFVDEQFAHAVTRRRERTACCARRARGFTGLQVPSAFGGSDYAVPRSPDSRGTLRDRRGRGARALSAATASASVCDVVRARRRSETGQRAARFAGLCSGGRHGDLGTRGRRGLERRRRGVARRQAHAVRHCGHAGAESMADRARCVCGSHRGTGLRLGARVPGFGARLVDARLRGRRLTWVRVRVHEASTARARPRLG